MKHLLRLALLVAVLAGGLMLTSPAARAQPENGYGGSHAGNAALNWAENHAYGHWYAYGGAGPSVYDCSGLIVAAFSHGAGIALPHSTYLIPGNRHVHRIPVSAARRGDILAFGTGHMELATIWYRVSFGAHHSGTRVSWIREWMRPTAAYRVD